MSGYDLSRAVMRDRWRRNFVLPNYTPAGWWECDVFELTDAGYWREYEVKVSRADFRRDVEKVRTVRHERRVKHDLLTERSPKGPSEFWFVMPAGLIDLAEVPEFAGLLEVTDRGAKHRSRWRYVATVAKKAPRLHKEKCPEKVVSNARGTCYWRMHGALETAEPMDDGIEYHI